VRVSVEAVIAELCGPPVSPDAARAKPADGGVPAKPGLYAWWTTSEDALPSVPLARVEGREEIGRERPMWLLYVGIAPSRPYSKQTLRGRVCGNHLRGNISGSTFRLSLAALLWQQEGFALTHRGNRALLTPEGNAALSAWQREHLRVSWVVERKPWDIEGQVIKALAPPLNLADNRQHPFAWTLSEARQRLRSAAMKSPGKPG